MAPLKSGAEGGAAAVADQLGTMSIRDDNKERSTSFMAQKFCSACGTTDGTLKQCAACLCVFYCGRKCQLDHRAVHKKDCKRIKKILEKRGSQYVERAEPLDPLNEDDLPPTEECPICMLPLPPQTSWHSLMSCCGKTICAGCAHEEKYVTLMEQTRNSATELIHWDSKCAFCRAPTPDGEVDIFKRVMERADDVESIYYVGEQYMKGSLVPRDYAKGVELFTRAANLGDGEACYELGWLYLEGKYGVSCDKAKAMLYFKRAAQKGYIEALMDLGDFEYQDNNVRAAMKHWRIAAARGDENSVTKLIGCFELEKLLHSDLSWCLQAKDKVFIETKSEQRTEYEKYKKEFGNGLHDGKDDTQYWLRRGVQFFSR